jgi:hypothetical protein
LTLEKREMRSRPRRGEVALRHEAEEHQCSLQQNKEECPKYEGSLMAALEKWGV